MYLLNKILTLAIWTLSSWLFIFIPMEKTVLNTVVVDEAQQLGGGDPNADKFIFYGNSSKTSGFNSQEILALDKKANPDRFIIWDTDQVGDNIVDDLDSGGEHMVIGVPVSYGGEGKFKDLKSNFALPFNNGGVVTISDTNGNTYSIQIWVWGNKSLAKFKLQTL